MRLVAYRVPGVRDGIRRIQKDKGKNPTLVKIAYVFLIHNFVQSFCYIQGMF